MEGARARAAALRVRHTEIDLDLIRGDQVFWSRTTLAVEAYEGADTFVDVRPRDLRAVTLDGEPLDPGRLVDGRYPLRLPVGEHASSTQPGAARPDRTLPPRRRRGSSWSATPTSRTTSSTPRVPGSGGRSSRRCSTGTSPATSPSSPPPCRCGRGWVVAESVREAYPRYAVSASTLATADALVDDPALDPSVRRAVVDSTDDLRRALAVRSRWPG